jgi:hypothetical protein
MLRSVTRFKWFGSPRQNSGSASVARQRLRRELAHTQHARHHLSRQAAAPAARPDSGEPQGTLLHALLAQDIHC